MCEKSQKTYTSCIKLNGAPILPPLLTPEKRKEALQYKQQAIKLEVRLKNCRKLKENLERLVNSQQLLTNRSLSSELTFRDNAHIDALGINDNIDAPIISPKNKKALNLSRDIIDVTEYNSKGIKIIYSEHESNEYKLCNGNESETDSSLNKSTALGSSIEYGESEKHKVLEAPLEHDGDNSNTPPKPRLIRSNSYTLDMPSPILMAHLQKSCNNVISNNSLNTSKIWASAENNYVPFENSEFSSINTVYHNVSDNKDNNSSRSKNLTAPSSPHTNKDAEKNGYVDETKSPTIEVFQTDISVQQITVNTVDNQKSSESSKKETFLAQDAFDFCDPESQLMQALQNIPENYSKQIIELLKKQKEEQQERLERFDNIQSDKTKDSSVKNKDTSKSSSQHSLRTLDNKSNRVRRSSTFSVSPSHSVYYSLTSLSDTITPNNSNAPSVCMIDMESEAGSEDRTSSQDIAVDVVERNSSDSKLLSEVSYVDLLEESNRSSKLIKEVFPSQFEEETFNAIKREWAASVIGAYVKGYLTRRLLRTEKVQTLIETIKDALICALQLHNAEHIDEADVELHRRLIQQVSAACYTFHDIFFALSTQEQMQLIAADRQHKKEKSKRPSSAPSSKRSASSSSRSSVKSTSSKLNTQSHSLTKV